MTQTQPDQDGTTRVIETIENAEKVSLEAVRKFLDTVNGAFPEVGEDGPRRKIIDSAFEMTEKLVNNSDRGGKEHPRRHGEGAKGIGSEVRVNEVDPPIRLSGLGCLRPHPGE